MIPSASSPAWLEQINPRILRCWRGTWTPGTLEPARCLYEHELVLVTQGGCTVRLDKTTHQLSAGHYIIIPPATPHITTTGPLGVHRVCVHFDWTHMPGRAQRPICRFLPENVAPEDVVRAPSWVPYSPADDGSIPMSPGTFDLGGPVPGLTDQLFERWASTDAVHASTARSLLQELLTRLLWREREAAVSPDRSTQLAWLVKDLLDSHFHKPAGIRTLMVGLGFSYEHLCRVFHAKFGLAPLSYLNAQRLERARALLSDPRRTIAEIAYANGFQDAGYFTRKFRQRYGVSPSQLRQGSELMG